MKKLFAKLDQMILEYGPSASKRLGNGETQCRLMLAKLLIKNARTPCRREEILALVASER